MLHAHLEPSLIEYYIILKRPSQQFLDTIEHNNTVKRHFKEPVLIKRHKMSVKTKARSSPSEHFE